MLMRTAHNIAEFTSLLREMPSLLNNDRDAASDALFTYLMKMRTGQSNESIGQYLGVNRNVVSQRLNLVRDALLKDIAPKYVNCELSRDQLIRHCTRLSKNLFTTRRNQIVVIWDATYVYVEKSLNHTVQKNTYNSHKKRNYVKPMLCVASDGYILCTVGPFMATENDASIMKKILPESIPAMRNFEEGDIMLVDRGFRDCIEEFESSGFEVLMPALAGGNRQLSTIDANRTRLVTKCRIQIEQMNGVIKNTFKIFSMTQGTYWIPNVMHDFNISAALINRLKQLRPQKIPPEEYIDEISRQMLERVQLRNALHEELQGQNLKDIIRQKLVFDAPLIFPKMSMEGLEKVSFGVYQINQAKLYAYDHMQENNGLFLAYTFPEECNTFPEVAADQQC